MTLITYEVLPKKLFFQAPAGISFCPKKLANRQHQQRKKPKWKLQLWDLGSARNGQTQLQQRSFVSHHAIKKHLCVGETSSA